MQETETRSRKVEPTLDELEAGLPEKVFAASPLLENNPGESDKEALARLRLYLSPLEQKLYFLQLFSSRLSQAVRIILSPGWQSDLPATEEYLSKAQEMAEQLKSEIEQSNNLVELEYPSIFFLYRWFLLLANLFHRTDTDKIIRIISGPAKREIFLKELARLTAATDQQLEKIKKIEEKIEEQKLSPFKERQQQILSQNQEYSTVLAEIKSHERDVSMLAEINSSRAGEYKEVFIPIHQKWCICNHEYYYMDLECARGKLSVKLEVANTKKRYLEREALKQAQKEAEDKSINH